MKTQVEVTTENGMYSATFRFPNGDMAIIGTADAYSAEVYDKAIRDNSLFLLTPRGILVDSQSAKRN